MISQEDKPFTTVLLILCLYCFSCMCQLHT